MVISEGNLRAAADAGVAVREGVEGVRLGAGGAEGATAGRMGVKFEVVMGAAVEATGSFLMIAPG